MSVIRIGNGAGFWGDDLSAPQRLVDGATLDYLTLEYLAELTLSILAHQRERDPSRGYVTDFLNVLDDLVPTLKSDAAPRIVTNAGGMNPPGCVQAVAKTLCDAGLSDVRVASVTGDDILERLDEMQAAGEAFCNLEDGRPLSACAERPLSANVYLGAAGIVDALENGAKIVVAGRVADASLTLGPAVHEFGWEWDDWNRLAAASVAGHVIECGAQASGGMYSDWDSSIDLVDVGYPIAELSDDGSVTITKPAGSGGTVTVATVAEQLVYEIGDPAAYMTPDVVVDFTHVQLEQAGPDRVTVTGARGRPAPETLKVSLAHCDGYAAVGTLVICGGDAAAKARQCGRIILERAARAGCTFIDTRIECLGAGDAAPGLWSSDAPTHEVVLRVAVRTEDRAHAERFLREFAPLVTSGPPGVTGYTGPRTRPVPVVAYWPALIDRTRVGPHVDVRPAKEWL